MASCYVAVREFSEWLYQGAADWYHIDADADDAAWFIDNSSVYIKHR